MPLSPAQLAQGKQLQTAAVAATNAVSDWVSSLVADGPTPPPAGAAEIGLFSQDESWGSFQALATQLGVGAKAKRLHCYGDGAWKDGPVWDGGSPAGTPLLVGIAGQGVAGLTAAAQNLSSLKATHSDVWVCPNFELNYSGNDGQPWGQQSLATILASNAAASPIIRALGFKVVCCFSGAIMTQAAQFCPDTSIYDYIGYDFYLNNGNGNLADGVAWAKGKSMPWMVCEYGTLGNDSGGPAFINMIASLVNGTYPAVGHNFFDLPAVGPLTAAAYAKAFA